MGLGEAARLSGGSHCETVSPSRSGTLLGSAMSRTMSIAGVGLNACREGCQLVGDQRRSRAAERCMLGRIARRWIGY